MDKIAITGGIGSGKSFICQKLEARGINVYDCDKAAKRIIASSDEVRTSLSKAVGDNVFMDNGKLNKALLSEFLLRNENNAQVVNSIVHPAVAHDFLSSGYNWMECAILFSSGFDKLVNKIICVTAPTNIRIKRIIERDGLTPSQAQMWINRQISQSEIISKSDFVILNDGIHDVDIQIDKILNILMYNK